MRKHFDLSVEELRIDAQALTRLTATERDQLYDELNPLSPVLLAVAATLRKYREARRDRLWEPAPFMLETARAALRIPSGTNKAPHIIVAIANLLVCAGVFGDWTTPLPADGTTASLVN
jgi:hypothetical protein